MKKKIFRKRRYEQNISKVEMFKEKIEKPEVKFVEAKKKRTSKKKGV